MSDNSLKGKAKYFTQIAEVVREIPVGCVMTYGQVAAESHTTARTVGWAMANITEQDLPWHRVVGSGGYLRIGKRSTELMTLQRALLEREGVTFHSNGCVNMDHHNAPVSRNQ